MTKSLEHLAEAKSVYTINKVLVHCEGKGLFPVTALKGGVQAMPVSRLGDVLCGMKRMH